MARNLTQKQKAFVRHYLECLNATEAARRAGYSAHTAREIGFENRHKPWISALIDEGLEVKLEKIRRGGSRRRLFAL